MAHLAPQATLNDFFVAQQKSLHRAVMYGVFLRVSRYAFSMALKLYNSYAKKEEDFSPKKEVTMYTCGPTVYGRPHIGNYASFLMADLLRRWLEAGHKAQVQHVKNITDVGHLVRDQDHGEDKLEKQAKEESGEVTHESVIAIARKYEAQYLEDEKALNLLEPTARPRASEFIEEMKAMIETLLKKGYAYVTEDGIYFRIEKFADYGRLSGNTLEQLHSGARIEVNAQKEHPADFALWKFCIGENEHHALRWPSPGGLPAEAPEGAKVGFPGWHIECSAMGKKLLGDTIDIHTGGEDLIFPHHECEIAQSECATGKSPSARFWIHKRFIDIGETKMSKSLGNVLSLDDVREKGFDPLDLRYYLLSVHYRTNLKFSWKGLEDAHKARRKILEWISRDGHPPFAPDSEPWKICKAEDIEQFVKKFFEAMNSDLNTPAALAVIFDTMKFTQQCNEFEKNAEEKLLNFIELIRHTFGCFNPVEEEIPEEVVALTEKRQAARDAKDFAESDRLRDEIAAMGYEVRDGAEGQQVKKL